MFARSKPKPRPAIPFGQRVYAIGDVHGEGDLLRRLLQLIKEDSAERRDAVVTLLFVGDLIDRGPDAAAVLTAFARMAVDRVVVLKGNHEEALVQAYRGDDEVLDAWMPFGAMTTLNGFGITLKEIDSTNTVFTAALQSRIDADLIAWLDDLPSAWVCGDYYFTHAGVRPGIDLDQQIGADLRWIREPFLSSRRDHGKVIVHGHTVEPGMPALGGNRIGIDTGAHENGVLTALGLEGERQWLLQAIGPQDREETGTAATADDLAAAVKAIVDPTPEPPDDALLLRSVHDPAKDPMRPVRRKRMGNAGYVAAGFALVLAAVGGVFAVRSHLSPVRIDDVSMSIPDLSGGKGLPAPAAPPTIAAAPLKVATGPRQPRRVTSGSSRLSGKALEKALEDDRAATKRVNLDEQSRQTEHDLPQ